jgi:two-component SAPR family response regulator
MGHVFGDIYDIASRVKEIDPALSLSFISEKKQYQLKRNNHHVMYIPLGQLDYRVLTTLRKGDLVNRGIDEIIRELERSEEEAERRKAKQLQNIIEDITLDKFNQIMGIKTHRIGHWREANGKRMV